MCYLVFSLKEEETHSKPREYMCEGEGVGSRGASGIQSRHRSGRLQKDGFMVETNTGEVNKQLPSNPPHHSDEVGALWIEGESCRYEGGWH